MTYHSESYVTSGLVAVAFATLIYFNMLGMHFIFGQKVSRSSVIGSLTGGLGVLLIFSPEVLDLSRQKNFFLGMGLGFLGTFFASCGNLTSVRHSLHKISVLSSTTWAMFYGALSTLFIILVFQKEFVWDPRPSYLYSLLYLSVFGTVIAFITYLSLMERLGADKASYTIVVTPAIALLISSFFESYTWTWLSIGGVALCLLGNYLVLAKKKV